METPVTEITAAQAVESAARAAKDAARVLANATRQTKDQALHAIADALTSATERIVAANDKDMERGRANGMSAGLLDRLALDQARIEAIAGAVREVAALPDPIGQVRSGAVMPNGLRITRRSVPLGVLGIIYEARPNVTVDAAALALKSGNAVLLRGGAAAEATNTALVGVIREALVASGLPAEAVTSLDEWGREGARELMRARGLVDALVPRGGAGLIRAVVEDSKVPVIETGSGNCHIYVDAAADLAEAAKLVMNSKLHRVGVCNAAETMLVHAEVAAAFLPVICDQLRAGGATLHGCPRTVELGGEGIIPATEEDWATEYLAPELAIRVVPDIDEAINHIRRWSSGHTEAICSHDTVAVRRFTTETDSAVIAVNASTRFTDGGEFGLGAEIGISTQKLHARGPMGLAELTTTAWVVEGDGHIRP